MTKLDYSLATVIIGLVAIFASLLLFAPPVTANPSSFVRNSTNSATALAVNGTTTLAYQSAGAATTTVVLNGNIGTTQTVDSAQLNIFRLASSSASKTRIDIQYSMDCDATYPTWYWASGTTTGDVIDGTPGKTVFWNAASSTIGLDGGAQFTGIGGQLQDTISYAVSMPAKCARALISVPVGASSSAIYAEFVGKRETN